MQPVEFLITLPLKVRWMFLRPMLLVFFLCLGSAVPIAASESDFRERWQALLTTTESLGDISLQAFLADRIIPERVDQSRAYFALPAVSPAVVISDNKALGDKVAANQAPEVAKAWEQALALGREESAALIAEARRLATAGKGWQAYRLLWKAHWSNPLNLPLAKMLGASDMLQVASVQPGSRAIAEIQWGARSYQEITSANFRVATTATAEQGIHLCADLERALAVWRQVFLPTWTTEKAIAEAIQEAKTPLVRGGPPMRVVLFPDRESYNTSLRRQVPGIEVSTGYYAPNLATTFLFGGSEADDPTRYHELTHQFLQEASRFRGTKQPGKEDGFWAVEGLATYAESIRWLPRFATIGGWESPRLQTARYRWLQQHHRRNLPAMMPVGQSQLAQIPDLAQWYTDAACIVHFLLDGSSDALRAQLFSHVEAVYRRGGDGRWDGANVTEAMLVDFLQVDDAKLQTLRDGRRVTELCLGGTAVTAAGLANLPELPDLRWLDLAGLPVNDDLLAKLLQGNHICQRLNLDRTPITDASAETFGKLGKLQELDISSTRAGESVARTLSNCQELRILWASASKVDDASLAELAQLSKLERIDLQLSLVTPQGLEELKKRRPQLDINPLSIQ
jgi:hypothetical protein